MSDLEERPLHGILEEIKKFAWKSPAWWIGFGDLHWQDILKLAQALRTSPMPTNDRPLRDVLRDVDQNEKNMTSALAGGPAAFGVPIRTAWRLARELRAIAPLLREAADTLDCDPQEGYETHRCSQCGKVDFGSELRIRLRARADELEQK